MEARVKGSKMGERVAAMDSFDFVVERQSVSCMGAPVDMVNGVSEPGLGVWRARHPTGRVGQMN